MQPADAASFGDPHVIATFAVLAAALLLFVTERLPVDVTALLIPIALGIFGVLTPAEALAGFGNPAVVTVAGMFVISRALVESGAVSFFGNVLQRLASGGMRRAILGIVLITGACSAFMNNTPVVVVFLPLVLAVAADLREAPSRFLIPLSYATMLGGCCTLIGTSTTVLVSGELVRRGKPPIAFFEPAAFGWVIVVVGALYLTLLAPRLLPVRRTVTAAGADQRVTEYVTEVSVLPGSPLVGRSIQEAFLARHPELAVVEIVRGQEILWPGTEGLRLEPGDLVLVRGRAEDVVGIGGDSGANLLNELGGGAVRGRDVTLVELVIAQGSPLVGRTVREATIRALPDATVMAVERRGSHLRSGIADLVLREGDTLLVQTEAARVPLLRDTEDFVLLEGLHERLVIKKRAPIVLGVAVSLVALASLGLVSIAFLAVGAALALVLLGCLPLRKAYRSLDMSTLVLMGATLSIGVALDKTGAAELVAERIIGGARAVVSEQFQVYAVLGACYALTNLLTAFASNSAAALLVLPIAIRSAAELGATDDRAFIMSVVFAASLEFATPTGYQTNLLVYGPGGYRYADYVRFGVPLNAVIGVLAVWLLPQFYPL